MTDLATYGLRTQIDMQAEIIAKMREALQETIPFINDAGNDEDPEAQQRANDLFVRIAAALALAEGR